MKDVFCTYCNLVTPHTAVVDSNGEFLFTCTSQDCSRFVKFPALTDASELQTLIDKHQTDNTAVAEAGQVLAAQTAILEQVLDAPPPDVTPSPEETPVVEVTPEVTEIPVAEGETVPPGDQ